MHRLLVQIFSILRRKELVGTFVISIDLKLQVSFWEGSVLTGVNSNGCVLITSIEKRDKTTCELDYNILFRNARMHIKLELSFSGFYCRDCHVFKK